MKKIINLLKLLAYFWISFWLLLGLVILPNQMIKDNSFIKNEIKPSVEFVKKFQYENKRLPTNREFYTWEKGHYHGYYTDDSVDLTNTEDSLITGNISYYKQSNCEFLKDNNVSKNRDCSYDFAISVWRGEWEEYYYSWSDSYNGPNSELNGLSILEMVGIALIPFLLWIIYYKFKKYTIYQSILEFLKLE